MKNTKNFLIIFLFVIIFNSCPNVFEPLNLNQYDGEKALIDIYIGETAMASARTITPNQSAVAGYQLTFTGGTQAPVNISGSNHAQFFLGNGNWIITATAYKLGSQIGNSSDAVASGNINVIITGGQVSGGFVPPITLSPIGTGNGTFSYEINIDTGITGSLTLWQIDGFSTVNSFGNNGVLSITSSSNSNITISTGRYIAEARLTRSDNFIAFRREVVEIWSETTSDFIFSPTVYLDPNVMLPNGQALLCETETTINGNPIGSGIGSGASEQDSRTYTFVLADRENVYYELVFQASSIYSTMSWTANTGNSPSGVYPNNGPLPTNFSTNSTLWVKAVSEDESEIIYYRFIIMLPNSNFGDFTVSSSNASGISWVSPNLTITESGTYHITGRWTVTNHRIRVMGNNITANIVLTNVNINISNIANATAFDTNVNNSFGVIINLTLIGENELKSGSSRAGLRVPSRSNLLITETSTGTLTSIGGSGSAGIGGSGVEAAGAITIAGGTITATGGSDGAGIGGGYGSNGGAVNITGGTVIATGGSNGGAGIGGGYGSNGGAGATVNITGGIIVATAGGSRCDGIGGGGTSGGTGGSGGIINISSSNVTATSIGRGGIGSRNGSVGELIIVNNSVVIANSIGPSLTSGVNVNDSIVFSGNNGTVYGNFILGYDLTISAGRVLLVDKERTLTIPSYITLLNNGTIRLIGTINGTVSGNQPITPELSISGSNSFNYIGDVLTITENGTYTISLRNGLSGTTQGRIVVAPGVNANITLSGVNITINNTSAFDMTGATVNLTLVGENVLRSGSNMAGLTVPSGSSLVITETSTGSLISTGGNNAAGIGGGVNVGTIIIQGGTVTAIGSTSSAGIGGGINGGGGTVTITGGIVTATGGTSGAGIGGGINGGGGIVSITGGIVTSTGGTNGAGIGGGANSGGSTVNITGGVVTAISGSDAFGIGRGSGFGSAGQFTSGNNAVVFANSIQPTLTEGNNVNNSIIFNGNNGSLYGNVVLQNNVTFSAERILTIHSERSLTIPEDVLLINNGIINNSGTIIGIVTGNQPVVP